jgi:tetratricopeptide (TPR) repeat protein
MSTGTWLVRGAARLTLLAVMALPSSRAQAAGERPVTAAITVDALVEQGFAAYRARDYRHAAEIFLRAHTMQPDPNLLFNIGRCYEALGDRQGAMEKYQLFLASPDADPAGRRRAEDALAALRRAPAGEPRPRVATASAPSPEQPASTHSALPYVGVGLGIAAVATGAVLYALGVRDQDRVTGAPGYGVPGAVVSLTEVQAKRLVDSGQTRKLAGGVAMGVGAAVLTASVAVLLALPSRPEEQPRRMAVSLAPASRGGSLVVAGSF